MAEQGESSNGWASAAAMGGAAAMSALGSAWNTYSAQKAAKYNTDRTIEANKAAAELAYQRQVEMWGRQNDYNSPQAQMERFKQAGLNPHLIYGQGNPGNASSAPQYHAPDIQYKYAAGNYGTAISETIPLLMQIGSWIQDMRLKDVQLKAGEQNLYTTDLKQIQAKQLIDFLRERNPQILKTAENQMSLFPYQQDMMRTNVNYSNARLQEFLHEVDWRWKKGGAKDREVEKFAEELQAARYKNKLLEAQSAYTDLDITNPQALMQMVLSGAMSFLGKSVNFKTPSASGKINQSRLKKKRTRSVGRDKTEFFEYE